MNKFENSRLVWFEITRLRILLIRKIWLFEMNRIIQINKLIRIEIEWKSDVTQNELSVCDSSDNEKKLRSMNRDFEKEISNEKEVYSIDEKFNKIV